jgi:hypothetical protein
VRMVMRLMIRNHTRLVVRRRPFYTCRFARFARFASPSIQRLCVPYPLSSLPASLSSGFCSSRVSTLSVSGVVLPELTQDHLPFLDVSILTGNRIGAHNPRSITDAVPSQVA